MALSPYFHNYDRPLAAFCLLLLAACNVTPKSGTVCESVTILPTLHDAEQTTVAHAARVVQH